jgi:hypothetical protein
MSLLKKDLDKFIPRKEQQDCIDFINNQWNENKNSKVFLLNLPVGTGKSHLALMIADWYKTNVSKGARVDIITNSKILQDQYTDTYNSINDLKGKENYDCQQYSCSCAEGIEFNRLNKTKCESCPHSAAKEGYLNGNVSLTNFYLYILYALYMPKLMEMRGSKVLIVDECLHPDTLISMSDGGFKMIKDINIDDMVKTINEETGELEDKPVLDIHYNLNKGEQMYEIEMDNGDILKITGNHKVKLIDGSWKRVDELNESDEILYIKENEST